VSDREAFWVARMIEAEHPDIARRIRRCVWKRRIIAGLSVVCIGTGVGLILYSLALYTVTGRW